MRRLGPEDAGAFFDLDTDIFGDDAWSAEMIAYQLQSDRVVALGRDGDNGLDAGAMLGRGIEAEILTISVRPHVRRQGVASAMLTELLEFARNDGAEACFLEVRASDSGARALYKQHGFEDVGVRKNYYRNDDGIIMKKDYRKPKLA